MRAEYTTSASGTGHSVVAEMAGPGVAREKRLGTIVAGVTAEKDAPVQVGNNPFIDIEYQYQFSHATGFPDEKLRLGSALSLVFSGPGPSVFFFK